MVVNIKNKAILRFRDFVHRVAVGKTTISLDKFKRSVQVDKQELFMSSDVI